MTSRDMRISDFLSRRPNAEIERILAMQDACEHKNMIGIGSNMHCNKCGYARRRQQGE